MSENEYLQVMMAKLIGALLRKDTEQNGNWGYPTFHQELTEMLESLEQTDAVKKAVKVVVI